VIQTGIIYPAQAHGISQAVTELMEEAVTDDEMVHLCDLQDSEGGIRVDLTSIDTRRYVSRKGTVYKTRQELEASYA